MTIKAGTLVLTPSGVGKVTCCYPNTFDVWINGKVRIYRNYQNDLEISDYLDEELREKYKIIRVLSPETDPEYYL